MELWLVSQACLIAPSIAEVVLPTNRILLPEHGHHPAALNFLIPGTHADARICGQVVGHPGRTFNCGVDPRADGPT